MAAPSTTPGPARARLSNLAQRVSSAAVAIPVLILVVWHGQPWLSILVGLLLLGGLIEIARLGRSAGAHPFLPFSLAWSLLFLVAAASGWGQIGTTALVTGGLVLPLAWLTLRSPGPRLPADWAWTVTGVFYLGWLLSHAVSLRATADGRDWLLLVLIATFGVDTFAYFGGRALGRRQMAPRISPKKTWEGAVFGFAGGIASAAFMTAVLPSDLPMGHAIALGAVIGVAGQVGDLLESALKRSAGAKDAGGIIPGHGGLLDRLDSIVVAIPVAYYYLQWWVAT